LPRELIKDMPVILFISQMLFRVAFDFHFTLLRYLHIGIHFIWVFALNDASAFELALSGFNNRLESGQRSPLRQLYSLSFHRNFRYSMPQFSSRHNLFQRMRRMSVLSALPRRCHRHRNKFLHIDAFKKMSAAPTEYKRISIW
jgi:hypothetical protein